MKTKFSLLIILILLTTNCVFSQIWKNDITGSNPSTLNPYTIGDLVVPNLTVSGIGRSPTGINGNNANDRYNAKNWYTAANPNVINTNKYFEFTLTANPGYVIVFQNFIYSSQASSTGPTSFSLRSSVDNFASDIPGASLGTNVSIDLSDPAFYGLSTITFRLYAWGATAGTGTFSVDDFAFWGSITDLSSNSLRTDDFKSLTSGSWNSASTWLSSHDGSTYIPATLTPDSSAASVTIQNGHTVTIDGNASAGNLYVNASATLIHNSGISLSITNGNAFGYDFTVDGTYVINGKQPTFSSSNCLINGTVRVDDNTGGESDLFATVPDVIFATGAVYQWNVTQKFGTANTRYFRYSGSNVPIFRVTQNVSNVGANSFTYFMGKFEVESGDTVIFANGGTKYFRNGIGGDGTIIHPSFAAGYAVSCGNFLIGDNVSTQSASIDGNIKILIYGNTTLVGATAANTDFIIGNNTTVTISGSPTITIGGQVISGVTAGALIEIDGTLINSGNNPIDISSGRLRIQGKIDVSSTSTFKCSSTFTRIISAGTTANTSVGILKLTSGFNTVYSLEMGDAGGGVQATHRLVLGSDVTVANNIALYKGILVTDYKKLILNYTGLSSITYPNNAKYKDSYIATCDQNGNPLVSTGLSPTTTAPFDGSVGFTISNVKGTSYIMFPIGSNFGRPNKIAINPNNSTTATNITVVVGHGDILYTPQPRVNRIWYVYTSDKTANAAIGIRLYFTKMNWSVSPFGSGQDEIEDGFNPAFVNVGRRDYTTDPHLTHRSPAQNLVSLNNLEDSVQYSTAVTPVLPGFYKFSAGNFQTIILPVSIVNVKAYKNGSNINIDWSALNELNTDHYEVERSSNGVAFSAVAQTKANNNGNTQNNYSAVDAHPINGNNFYRIKAIDKDGQIKYSAVVSVNINSSYVGIKVLPNPVNNRLMNVQLSNLPAGKYDLLLYSTNGQRVYNTSFTFNGGFASQVIVLPPNIRTGAYVLKLFNGTNKFTQNIMVE